MCPALAAYVPRTHVVHAVMSGSAAYVPAGHSVHGVCVVGAYVPASQSVHAAALAVEYVPGSQPVQVEAPAPEYLPPSQLMQVLPPRLGEYLPSIQFVHSSDTGKVDLVPALQGLQSVLSAVDCSPLLHISQEVERALDFLPLSHCVHVSMPSCGIAENFPAGQSLHLHVSVSLYTWQLRPDDSKHSFQHT